MNIHIKSALSALVFSLLFYSKSFGLNLFLISILVVVLVATVTKERQLSKSYSLAYIATGLFVFLNPTSFSIFVHFMAFLVFIGKSISVKTSLHISWLVGLINMIIASAANYTQKQNTEDEKTKNLSPEVLNRIKGSVIAIVFIFIFGLLYKNANPVFENLIDQIDLDFISIPWLFFTAIGYVLFVHILRPFDAKEIIDFDLAQPNELIKPTEIEIIKNKQKLASEHTIGSIIFIALNSLLVFFLVTDAIYLLTEKEISNAGYSQSVHQGVYALMFSIVCAILLILYFFRGNLNFYTSNKRIKSLTYTWVILNLVLVLFTAFKNYTYVSELGLTYKRIGVFVYLILTLVGLVTAYIKVSQIKNFIYLLRTNITVVFSLLVFSAAIPWDKTITWYNINHIEHPDVSYLINLGDNNSLQLLTYAKNKTSKFTTSDRDDIGEKFRLYDKEEAKKTWQEYNWYHVLKTSTN